MCISAWGRRTKLDSVEVRWPSGLTERFDGLGIDRIHTLKEGTGVAATSTCRSEALAYLDLAVFFAALNSSVLMMPWPSLM